VKQTPLFEILVTFSTKSSGTLIGSQIRRPLFRSERLLRQEVAQPGQGGGRRDGHRVAPGIDLTKLHFGRKLFGQIFLLKFQIKSHP
jgi:hypothetical protein